MITLRKVTLARGARVLVEGVDLTLHAGERIGVVGANGCGKSTLLGLLAGDLHVEAGDLEMPPTLAVARVAQETPGSPVPAIEYVLDGDLQLRSIERSLREAEAHDEGERIASLHAELERIDGYGARSRAAALLAGLGFAPGDESRPVESFSGGWRMRLNLARALIARSDLLLLDEPTNHLDLDAVLWLERWLASYPGMLLLVSHDRDFLDACVTRILSFEGGRIASWRGNYSDFETQRTQALALQQAAYARQQRTIEHLTRFVERFRAKATKARQAQSRLKALERMERIAAAHVDSPFSFGFEPPAAAPSPLLAIEEGAAGYGATPILAGVNLSLLPGARLGVLGRNGAGKSTLVKLLAGELAPSAGVRREGKGLAIGYFAQHQLEQLRADETPLQHLVRLDPSAREQDLRDFLGRFGFGGEQALAPVGPFSGGERSRLALALIVRARPNLLLLDEPTNHLDLEMRHALTLALQEYEGAVVVVSHDRHLLRTTVDRFVRVANGRCEPFDGDLDDYRAWLAEEARAVTAARAEPTKQRRDERRARVAAQDARAATRRPLEKELRAIETKLEALAAERARIDALIADPANHAGEAGARLAETYRRRAALEDEVTAAEARWLELSEALEALG